MMITFLRPFFILLLLLAAFLSFSTAQRSVVPTKVIAGFYDVADVKVDRSGNVYVSDVTNVRIMKFDPSGAALYVINTTAGAIALDPSDNLYVLDRDSKQVLTFNATGAQQQAFAAADNSTSLFDIAVDSLGDIYVSTSNQTKKFNNTGMQLAFTASPGLLAVDAADNLFVANYIGWTIVKFSAAGVQLQILPLPPPSSPLSFFNAMVVDSAIGGDHLYLTGTDGVVKLNASGVVDPTFAVPAGSLSYPAGIAIDSAGAVYVADSLADWIHYTDSSAGVVVKFNTTGGYEQTFTAPLPPHPTDIAVDSAGNMYVMSKRQPMVKLNADGTRQQNVTSSLSKFSPRDIAVDSSGNIYVADTDRVTKLNGSGIELQHFTVSTSYFKPTLVSVDGSGNVYVVDLHSNSIVKFNSTGAVQTVFQNSSKPWNMSNTRSIAADGLGNVYFTSEMTSITKVNPSGIQLPFDVEGDANAAPIAVDAYNNVLVCNGPSEVLMFSSAGAQIRVFSVDSDGIRCGLAVDSFDNVYVTDFTYSRIIVFPSGYVPTAAPTSPTPAHPPAQGPSTVTIDIICAVGALLILLLVRFVITLRKWQRQAETMRVPFLPDGTNVQQQY